MTKKISKQQLEQIIQEELTNVLTEEQLEEFLAGLKAAAGVVGQGVKKVGKAALDKAKSAAQPAIDAYKDAEKLEKRQKLAKEMDFLKDRMVMKLQQLQRAAGPDNQEEFQRMLSSLLNQLTGQMQREPLDTAAPAAAPAPAARPAGAAPAAAPNS